MKPRFSQKVSEKLRYYVYLYIDPRNGRPFYVGKGKSNRAFSHLKMVTATTKVKILRELAKLGHEPRIEILKYNLTEKEAILVEAATIDLLGLKKLTNQVHGHRKLCRMAPGWLDHAQYRYGW